MKSNEFSFLSPAKINLFLRILGKRTDGYHEIASLFQTIDLFDEISFHLNEKEAFITKGLKVPSDDSNLILKALNLFRKKTTKDFTVRICLNKRIPQEAGLGGGSSNAATTLWALNLLNNSPASLQELQNWSSEIGSDIPFFFSKGTAFCRGRGEKVENLKPIATNTSLFLVKPEGGLSTPLIFRELSMEKCTSALPEDLLSSFYSKENEKAWKTTNDLEEPSFRLCPKLFEHKQKLLENGAKRVWMTGSGTGLVAMGGSIGRPIRFIHRKSESWYSPKL